MFINIVGDLSVDEIDEDQALNYIETLKQLPANMNKMSAYRDKTIQELIELKPPPMSTRTFNKYVEPKLLPFPKQPFKRTTARFGTRTQLPVLHAHALLFSRLWFQLEFLR